MATNSQLTTRDVALFPCHQESFLVRQFQDHQLHWIVVDPCLSLIHSQLPHG